MLLNKIVFPAPPPTYNIYNPNLYFVPKEKDNKSIPVFFIPYLKSNRLMIFFHGNAEDINCSYPMMKVLAIELKVLL